MPETGVMNNLFGLHGIRPIIYFQIGCIQTAVLVFEHEIAHFLIIVQSLVFQVTEPCRQIHRHVRKAIQPFGQFVYAPFQAAQVRSVKA